jgi:Domain of unknown function (DUF362)
LLQFYEEASMSYSKNEQLRTPVGKQAADSAGSPIGAVRVDVERSYAGIGDLLKDFINDSNQGSWQKIRRKIDYIYECLDAALGMLEEESGFGRHVKERVGRGQKLFFKPNLVTPMNIDCQTHGPDVGSTACTEWSFVAALMRWFHDRLGIRYHQMALGEAATFVPAAARFYTRVAQHGRAVTPEAVIEGRSGDFYGGWGFYFARKYLAESVEPGMGDDPMQGFEESVAATYIPPGMASDRLMVYDLNRIFDDPNKGRAVEVPDGINFESITLHKAIVGGDPDDPEDRKVYPGCVLVNVPKLKVHSMTLLTNVIKNLGIGLYPMQSASGGGYKWDYSVPHHPTPGMKGGIPHQVWVPEMDMETGFPRKDASGKYTVERTGGITATMIDIIQAVRNADVLMIHVVDGIEGINHDHTGLLETGTKEPEGVVFAGLDPVATDLLSARYMFTNIALKEALEAGLEDGNGGQFSQRVPVPTLEDNQILTQPGYDSPLSRDVCFENAGKRGLGQRGYYVVGKDAVNGNPLVSIQGHLGTVKDGSFQDVITKTLYCDDLKMPWDMQKTALSYLEAVDKLTGSSLKKEFLDAYDEDRNGVITYEEFGTQGVFGVMLHMTGRIVTRMGIEEAGMLQGKFSVPATLWKLMDASWNPHRYDLLKEYNYGLICGLAYQMSLLEIELPDLFVPGLTWGKGKWPSFELARHALFGMSLYGEQYPNKIQFPSLYGLAFCHADHTQNEGRYVGRIRNQPDPEGLNRYVRSVGEGKAKALDFTLYVPPGFDNLSGNRVPNVEVPADPSRVFTASFASGTEIWSPDKPLA